MSVLTAKEVVCEYRNSHQTLRAVNGVSYVPRNSCARRKRPTGTIPFSKMNFIQK